MLVFAGTEDLNYFNDVWALSLVAPTWSLLTPGGSPPAGRVVPTAIYDPLRDRMVMFGGGYQDGSDHNLNDVWALSLSGSPAAWTALNPAGSPPPGRYAHTAIYDAAVDRMVVFAGGTLANARYNDVWMLRWTTPASVEDAPAQLRLGVPRPNPSRGGTFVDFELAKPARVTLDVFDAQGRRVKRVTDQWFAAGRHVSMWRGDDEAEHALGTGVYFIRMQAGSFQATRRTVRVR
jgi:hypothetical protein